jgi:hypothetical protein
MPCRMRKTISLSRHVLTSCRSCSSLRRLHPGCLSPESCSSIRVAWIGVILFGASSLFALITLPVEFNASARALNLLVSHRIIQGDEQITGVREVLGAAAWTYVAAAVSALGSWLFYVFVLLSQRKAQPRREWWARPRAVGYGLQLPRHARDAPIRQESDRSRDAAISESPPPLIWRPRLAACGRKCVRLPTRAGAVQRAHRGRP